MGKNRCVLCGKEIEAIGQAYLERGISKKDFLCGSCYNKKMDLRDYNASAKRRNAVIEFFEKKIENRSPIVQDIVRKWINGEEENYYPYVNSLVYYVEGLSASLFVFKDHVTILSNRDARGVGFPLDDKKDYVFFYRCKVRESERKVTERKTIFICYDDKWEKTDLQKIRGDIVTEKVSGWTKQSVELNISVGQRGTLDFGKKYSFKFFYHQNQLMEEVYNYIQNCIANPDAEVAEVSPYVSKSSSATAKYTKKKEEAQTVFSPADEIKKMKELFDCGILTQEEFDRAKNKLIDMM